MEILLYYVLPNIALFGGICALAKLVEYLSWQGILFVTGETNTIYEWMKINDD